MIHRFDPPERFVVGTVGEPGQRTFFMQARTGRHLTTIAAEKEQVQILAERIGEMLDELAALGNDIPVLAPASLIDDDPLERPIVEEFKAGTITLSWDQAEELVIVEVFPVDAEASSDPASVSESELADLPIEESEPSEVFLVRMSAEMARSFCARAELVVAGGRPSCDFCGRPLDPTGHLCVRANGFRRR